MHHISTALRVEQGQILAFLERRGLVENVWLISAVNDGLMAEGSSWTLFICWNGDRIVGATSIIQNGNPQEAYDWDVLLDAEDAVPLSLLIDALPVGRMKCVGYRLDVRQHLMKLLEAEWSEGDLYFTTSAERFTPAAGEAVRELTRADSRLFDASEIREPRWDEYGERHWVFGILRNGRVACKTGTGELPGLVLPCAQQGRGHSVRSPMDEPYSRNGGTSIRLSSKVKPIGYLKAHAAEIARNMSGQWEPLGR